MSNKKESKLNESNIFDAKHVEILESKNRKDWQNPKEIMNHLELKPSQIVADVGCGSGYFTVPISSKVKKIYAIDIQQEMLDHLEKKIRMLNIKNIEPLLSKDNKIPLQDENVDLLLSVNTLHEFQDKENMIKEIQRVIKHNGRAVIVDFKKENMEIGPPLAIRVSKDHATNLFEKQGLTVLKTHDLPNHYLIIFQKN